LALSLQRINWSNDFNVVFILQNIKKKGNMVDDTVDCVVDFCVYVVYCTVDCSIYVVYYILDCLIDQCMVSYTDNDFSSMIVLV